MIRGNPRRPECNEPSFAIVLAALSTVALAQSGGPRTLSELKTEVQERADRKVYPVSQLEPAEVREALAALKTLDRDEWAAAWSAIGDRHMAQARKAESNPPRHRSITNTPSSTTSSRAFRWRTPGQGEGLR